VYDALGPQMRGGIHALAITAKAPGEDPDTAPAAAEKAGIHR
jgi:stress-induced morphogen